MRSVLIIEDNKDNFYLMRYLLENSGYKVLGADSGWMGIEIALYNNPDLIILDIQLPGMDGYSVVRHLRKHSELVSTPIVVVSSFAMANNKEIAINSGANGFIEKPIDPDCFVTQLENYLNPLADKEQ